MNSLKIVVLSSVLALSACMETSTQTASSDVAATPEPAAAPAAVAAAQNPVVTPAFAGGGGRWGESGRVTYRYTAIERDGEIYVCGAYSGTGSVEIRAFSREMMRQATVRQNGETVLRNLRFFKEASNANMSTSLVGVETNCLTTGLAAGSAPLNAFRVVTREGTYRIRR